MKLIDVIVPGPWWNTLTYLHPEEIPSGARVRVPVGRGIRTGLVQSVRDGSERNRDRFKLRKISEVIDRQNLVGKELWALSLWMSSRFLCSRGQVLETMLPRPFLHGREPLGEFSCGDEVTEGRESLTEKVYEPQDQARWERYKRILDESVGNSLILFPEQFQAKAFWNSLSPEHQERTCLWPPTNGKKKVELWKAVRRGELKAVVGSPGALFAPLQNPLTVIVEGESSGAFVSQSAPFFNCRTVAARRARFWGARLVLGASMPSSRVYRQDPMKCPSMPRKRLLFIDTHRIHSVAFAGVRGELRISQPLLEETLQVLESGKVALWLLDRKGFAGEVLCDDCGNSLTCPSCQGTLRWDRSTERLLCIRCGKAMGMPNNCPSCGGYLLEGNRPGLEALADIARGLLGQRFSLMEWDRKKKGKDLNLAGSGTLVLGSRGSLELCDREKVGLIGWIDSDAEAHRPTYDARFQAFRMIWESIWRGQAPSQRKVIIQSRAPGKDWQIGLKAGWDHFWNRELHERKELELPPYAALVQIQAPAEKLAVLKDALEQQGLIVLDPLEGGEEIWVQSPKIGRIYRTLAPFMEIGKPLGGFPLLRTWLD